jgi:transketolase
MIVIRPCDANETAEAWRHVMTLKEQPSCLILSRQNLPTLDRTIYASAAGLNKGAYVLAQHGAGDPEVILMATGSEVGLVVQAYEKLVAEGIRARVVSFPSWDLFEAQPEEYRHSVLPPHVTGRLAVEQASTIGWDRYIGSSGAVIGMHTFGASAPMAALLKKFGFTPEAVLAEARRQAGRE